MTTYRPVVTCAALLVAGCAGTLSVPLLPSGVPRADVPLVAKRRVAIVLEADRVPVEAPIAFGAGTFMARHVRPLVELGLTSLVGASAARIDVFVDERPPGYAVYVVPDVHLSLGSRGLVVECRATTSITVLDAQGRVVSTREATVGTEYVWAGDQEDACSSSATRSLEQAARAALGGERAPQRAAGGKT